MSWNFQIQGHNGDILCNLKSHMITAVSQTNSILKQQQLLSKNPRISVALHGIWFTAKHTDASHKSYDANNSKNTTETIKYLRQSTTCRRVQAYTHTHTHRHTTSPWHWHNARGTARVSLLETVDFWLQSSMQWLVLQVRTTFIVTAPVLLSAQLVTSRLLRIVVLSVRRPQLSNTSIISQSIINHKNQLTHCVTSGLQTRTVPESY